VIIETFKKLVSRSDDEIDWIVTDLISSGEWTFLVGESGVGKSMLLIQMCHCIQYGKSFLGMTCPPRNCLYIQVDVAQREWRHQIKSVTGTDSMAWTMYSVANNFLDSSVELERIRKVIWADYYSEDSPDNLAFRAVLKGQQFGLVIFDVLNKMTVKDLNSKEGFSYVNSRLNSLTSRGEAEERESVHYILVHHPSKSQKTGVDAGAGSSAFSNTCGTKINMSKHLLSLEKSKVIVGKEILIERLPSGGWKLKEEDEGDYDRYKDILG